MEADLHDEWPRFEAEARRVIDGDPGAGGGLKLQAVVHPSFDDSSSYAVVVPVKPRGAPPRWTKRIWRRHIDRARFESPVVRLRHGSQLEPTIHDFEAQLPEAEVAALLARTSNLKVSPRPTGSFMAIDGTSYRLVIHDGFTSSRFEWWARPPSGWDEINGLLRDLVAIVDEALGRA